MGYRAAVLSAACLATLFFALPVGNRVPSSLARSAEGGRLSAKEEPLVEKVRVAIQRGVQYLKDQENNTGNWDKGTISARFASGESALAMLALLNAGVSPDDPVIQRGLERLRKQRPQHTYVVSLQTMVLALAGKVKDREQIQSNVDWLIAARVMNGNQLLGWTYGKGGGGADASNTQYALLALHDARMLGGAKVDREIFVQIRDLYRRTQNRDGGWGYTPGRESIITMSTAGLCGLYIAASELNDRRETLNKDGTADNCGVYEEDAAIARGHAWLSDHFTVEHPQAIYYSLYGLERTGRLSGQRFLGNHDWYREGCSYLVSDKLQNKEEGSWPGKSVHDSWPIVSTSFALLFLSKGRTPVLISKFAHAPGNDWNNDRHDIRNLTDYASKEMFKRTPLAWQVWDTKRAQMETDNQILDAAGELLQSPILYINGHRAPEFTGNEKRLLREYVNNGGFILAEACCGKKEFADKFRAVVKELFEDDLTPLPEEHPIWRAWAPIAAGTCPFKLEGLQQGCKTIVVFSPQDMSCLWEANQRETPRGQLAFRLGGNIIAYATGMELPKPRLTPNEVARVKEDPKQIPRGFLKVAQIRHGGDWQPAPKAMRNLMQHLRQRGGLDVALQTEPIRPGDDDLPDFKFLYMHGRAEFRMSDDDCTNLRANLQSGGLLLADACCGKKPFDRSFRTFMEKLFPDHKLERIPLNDDLFSKDLNGEAIKTVRCRVEGPGGAPEKEYKDVPPYLEGIKIDGHWVVIYSKYDLGCALEKHPSSDCLGHDHASALRLGTAAVLYALKR